MTGVVYLDASAILKLVVDEPQSADLRAFLAPRLARATSVVGAIETRRVAYRRRPDSVEHVAFVLGGIDTIDLDDDVAAAAATLRPFGLRSLDAIHVASAQGLGRDLEALVTYDGRMIAAARVNELPVASPGGAETA